MESADKYIRYPVSNDFVNPIYDEVYQRSIKDKEGFWAEKAKDLVWTKQPTKIVDTSDQYLHRWYPDGEMNICYNCIDRHVDNGKGAEPAFYYDSAYTGVQEMFTFRQV
jgi:propionyl-CoA synthetase